MHPKDGRVISNFIMQALANKDITLFGDGKQTRSFQYCDDLVEAFRRYMELSPKKIATFFGGKKAKGRVTPAVPVINTGNPGEYTIKELAEETLPASRVEVEDRLQAPARRRPEAPQARHHARKGASRLGAEGAA